MPAITDIRLPLTVEEITSSWGPRRARLATPRVTAMLSDLIEQIRANKWIQPRATFHVWPVTANGLGWVELRGGQRISSRTLGHHLPGALEIAAGICTIGAAVEQKVSKWFASSDRLRAVMLDEIATLTLFRVADQLEELMRAEAGRRGLDAGGVLSPGEDGFEISQQATVLALANSAETGVSQTTGGMLKPRKSLSMIVGFGTRMPKWTRGDRCARCGARERCPHRRLQVIEVTA